MSPMFRDAAVVGALISGLLLLTPSARWRPLALGLAVAGVVSGLVLGFLIPADLLRLPAWAGLQAESAALVGWAIWGLAARRAPRPWLPGPSWLVAWLAGALFGEIAGAALVAAGEKDGERAGRLAMAAAAGGLLGRAGDPALLALGDRVSPLWLLPLSGALLLLARPGRAAESSSDNVGSRVVTAIGAAVALAVWVLPAQAAALLLVGAAALWATGRRADAETGTWREPAWVLSSVILALIAASAGLLELLADAFEWMVGEWGHIPLGVMTAAAGLVAMLIDGPVTGLAAAATLDRALDLRGPGLGVALAVGTAVGGLGPLVIAGGLRTGFRRWVLGILLAALYVQALSGWLNPS